MIITQWDATNPAGINHDARAAAFYMDGLYANEEGVKADAPHAIYTSITVAGHPLARICDTEPGNIGVAGAMRWLKDQRRTDPLHIGADNYGLYADGSDWLGIERVGYPDNVKWLAKPDNDPTIPPGYHAKQYRWAQLYDLSSCSSRYFVPVPPKPPSPFHYERYPLGPFRVTRTLVLNERATVQEYDRLIVQHSIGRAGHARIGVLRAHIKLLRDRVWTVAHQNGQGVWGNSPDWTTAWRGWRWQKLNDRLSGHVVL